MRTGLVTTLLLTTTTFASSGCFALIGLGAAGLAMSAVEAQRERNREEAFKSGPMLVPQTARGAKNEWRFEGEQQGALCFIVQTDAPPSQFGEPGALTFWPTPKVENEGALPSFRVIYDVLSTRSETHYRTERRKSEVRDGQGRLAGTVEREETVPYEVYDSQVRACAEGVPLPTMSGKLAVLTTPAGESMWRVPGKQAPPAAPQAKK
jgi:hypothetical protein